MSLHATRRAARCAAALLVLAAAPARAQTTPPARARPPAEARLPAGDSAAAGAIELGGQLRPRFESRSNAPGAAAFTSMRTRIHAAVALADVAKLFVQVQDVRFWGGETNTLTDFTADAFDLHQAYVDLGTSTVLRVGRQEASLGGQRLVGAVDWAQQGRAFDGLRLRTPLAAGFALDAFAFQLAESAAAPQTADASLLGAVVALPSAASLAAQAYVLNDRAGAGTDRATLGARAAGDVAGFPYRLEGAYQTGRHADRDVAAYLVAARVGHAVGGRAAVTLWYDYLSGDADPADDTERVFDTLFATNHKFYGYADLFTAIPAQTAGHGLQDIALKTSLRPAPALTLGADLHAFRAAASAGLPSSRYGEELDVTAAWRWRPPLALSAGVSGVAHGPALPAVGGPARDFAFVYLMLDATF